MRTRRSISPHRSAELELRARAMRHAPSVPEATLWRALRSRQLGALFRRQVPLAGFYIGDFVAVREKLVVEVDGAHHARRRGADARRDRALFRLGYRVLRLPARLVLTDLEAAVARVRAALRP